MKPHHFTTICDTETPVSLYAKLAQDQPYSFLLESGEPHETLGRYSIIGFEAEQTLTFPADGTENPLHILKKAYEACAYEADPELPRIQAPFVGYLGYEAARHMEKLDLPLDKNSIPEGIFFLPKYLLVYDHQAHTLCGIAYSEKNLEALKKLVKKRDEGSGIRGIMEKLPALPRHAELARHAELVSASHNTFSSLVTKAKSFIESGELLQIVLSQKFEQHTEENSFNLYRRLRLLSPSPYLYYLNFPNFSIIGSSPETLVRTEGDDVILRPIAGTRRRGETPEEDNRMEEELRISPKEQAEHMMLLDLGRHEMGRVAKVGSVRTVRLMEIEKYSHVMHMVSEIRGKRLEGISLFDIFKTAFPAGTLTGAPKIRAMEIIAKLEGTPRSIYGGAVGYFDLSGNMDFAIAIRTMLYKKVAPCGRNNLLAAAALLPSVTLRAGAGIVYDSIPAQEDLECRNKAKGPLSVLRHCEPSFGGRSNLA